MYCSKCGKKIKDEVKFCQYCGAPTRNIPAQDRAETMVSKIEDSGYIWAYHFTETETNNLSIARHYIEQKGDYFPVKTELNPKDIFVYQKGKGKKVSTVILYKQDNQIVIFGNEGGYVMIRSRYLNKNFKNIKKEKINNGDIKNQDILSLIDEFNIKKGNEFDGPIGVGGWLILPLISFFILTPFVIIEEIITYQIPKDLWWVVMDIGIGAYSLYVGYKLIRIRHYAVRHAKIFLSILLVISIINAIIIASSNSWSSADSASSPYTNSIRAIISCIIWILYFQSSKRVKATYKS